jgi:hypothetical protein
MSLARCRSVCASAARELSASDCASRKSISLVTPFSKRSLLRRSVSSRVASVSRVSRSSSSSAASASQVLATVETSVICAALRPSSVAKYWASAASLRLAMRPKKSSSQLLTARFAV